MDLIETHIFTDAAEQRGSGTLWVPFALTQPGVFDYIIDGKRTRVLKSPEDWHSESFLASANGAPITLEHPPEGAFSPSRPRQVVGMADSSAARVAEDSRVLHGGTLFDADAIAQVSKRKIQGVSVGFRTELKSLSGVWEDSHGTKYEFDAVQTKPVINHTALTRSPRVKSARILLDSTGRQHFGVWHEDTVMNLTDALAQCDSQIGEVLKATLSAKDAELAKFQTQLDSLRGELTAAKAALDSAPTEAAIAQAVKDRLNLLKEVAQFAPQLALDSLVGAETDRDMYLLALDSLNVKVDPQESIDFLRAALRFSHKVPGNNPNSPRAALMERELNDSTTDMLKRQQEAQMRKYGLLKGKVN